MPERIEAVVMRALAREPADRFLTARELADALAGVEATLPVGQAATGERGAAEKSIAVLPFTNLSADPENEYFSDGITEEIINALSKLGGLRVAARSSSFAFKGKAFDIGEVGAKLRVGTVLEGSVRKAGNRVRITAQLIHVADGYHLWSERYDRELEDVFAIQDEIAKAIVETLRVKLLGEPEVSRAKRQADSLEAYDLYLKGRYFWYQRGDGLGKAVSCFGQAVERDPGYAAAYAGLADTYNLLGFYHLLPPREAFPAAQRAATRALELDPTLAEAHTSRGYTAMLYEWDWVAAEQGFRQALELDPAYATAHHWYSEYLMAMGRVDEAVGEAKQARELDVLGLVINTLVGMALYYAREYGQAIAEFRRIMEMEPKVIPPYLWLGLSYVQQGRHEDAVRAFEKGCALPGAHPYMLGYLGYGYGLCGRTDDAVKVLEDLEARGRTEYVSSVAVALAHLGLGRSDRALASLETACEERDASLFWLGVEPAFDPLRSEPRFRQLLARTGLG